jgi:hypothetical protein
VRKVRDGQAEEGAIFVPARTQLRKLGMSRRDVVHQVVVVVAGGPRLVLQQAQVGREGQRRDAPSQLSAPTKCAVRDLPRHTAHGTRHTAHGTRHTAHGTRHTAHEGERVPVGVGGGLEGSSAEELLEVGDERREPCGARWDGAHGGQ